MAAYKKHACAFRNEAEVEEEIEEIEPGKTLEDVEDEFFED